MLRRTPECQGERRSRGRRRRPSHAIVFVAGQGIFALVSTAILFLRVETHWMALMAFWPFALSIWLYALCRDMHLPRPAQLFVLPCVAATISWFLVLLAVIPVLSRT